MGWPGLPSHVNWLPVTGYHPPVHLPWPQTTTSMSGSKNLAPRIAFPNGTSGLPNSVFRAKPHPHTPNPIPWPEWDLGAQQSGVLHVLFCMMDDTMVEVSRARGCLLIMESGKVMAHFPGFLPILFSPSIIVNNIF